MKRRNLLLLALVELLAKSLWFTASAVVPQLTVERGLGPTESAWLTMSVQLGFVVGALASAVSNLSDRVPLHVLIGASTLAGAAFNAGIPFAADLGEGSFPVVLVLRALTGASIAWIYPPGMKLVATWTRGDRGLWVGVLVGALTFGSAVPHLLNATPGGMPSWRAVLFAASALATIGALLAFTGVRPGPHLPQRAPFDWRFVGRALRHRPTRLANFGYLGHMWELYAMWAWVPILLIASYDTAGWDARLARIAGFGTIAAGTAGSVFAGRLADRYGRTAVTIGSLALSGTCALVAGLLFTSPAVLTIVCLVWGFAVVADSAQFSTAVSELTDPRYVGTALTLQTSLGFLLTMLTIAIVPALADAWGWARVLPVLALGPIFGITSMARLRALPEATRMASGRR